MDPDKIKVILSWEAPSSIKGVQSFLGLCNFYRRFIRGYSLLAKPLTDLTKKENLWDWTTAYQQAFESLKIAIRSDPVLRHFDLRRTVYIEVDLSDYVSGGVLI